MEETDGSADYFTVMRKFLLLTVLAATAGCGLPRWPAAGTMTSPYGFRLNSWRPDIHHGVDISMPVGSTVKAMKSGVVEFAGVQAGYGNVVVLRHGSWTTVYAHLSELKVRTGAKVDGGSVIGLSGMSGNASGPHLHFEVSRKGQSADPVLLLGGPPPVR